MIAAYSAFLSASRRVGLASHWLAASMRFCLFIDGVKALAEERAARKLSGGPEREVIGDLGYLHALIRRLSSRLGELKVPLEPTLLGACQRLHVALPTVAQEISRLVSS